MKRYSIIILITVFMLFYLSLIISGCGGSSSISPIAIIPTASNTDIPVNTSTPTISTPTPTPTVPIILTPVQTNTPITYVGMQYYGKGKILDANSPVDANNFSKYPDLFSNIIIEEPKEKSFEADGFFTVKGINKYLDPNNVVVFMYVSYKNSNKQQSCSVIGNFDKRAWLRDGPGVYEVGIYCYRIIDDPWPRPARTLYKFTVTNTRNEDGYYLYPSLYCQSDDQRISDLALSITSGLSSEKDKVKAIHDYVVKFLHYDYISAQTGIIIDQDALSVFQKKTAVCSGYTDFFNALLRSIGIKAKYVRGNVYQSNGTIIDKEHAWSNVFCEGNWYFVDTTWDEPYPEDDNSVIYKYFMLTNLNGVVTPSNPGGDHKPGEYPVDVEHFFLTRENYLLMNLPIE